METKDILDRAESAIFKISEDAQVAGAGLKPIKGALAEVSEQITKLYNSKNQKCQFLVILFCCNIITYSSFSN